MSVTIYYVHLKVRTLLPKYEEHLHDGKLTRWIDDIFGIWACHECRSKVCHHRNEFKNDLPFGQLTWSTKNLTKITIFLDLDVRIESNIIITTHKSSTKELSTGL